jgi:hypothetical protein
LQDLNEVIFFIFIKKITLSKFNNFDEILLNLSFNGIKNSPGNIELTKKYIRSPNGLCSFTVGTTIPMVAGFGVLLVAADIALAVGAKNGVRFIHIELL